MSRNRVIILFAIVLMSLTVVVACSSPSPEEKTAQLRSRYDARVNSFYIQSEPVIVEAEVEPEGEEEMAADEPAAAEDGTEAEEEEMAVVQNAHLDLIVQHDANEMLPGITVEIFMIDAAEQEKGRWQLWVDTSTLRKANQLQLTHILEDIPYVEGDGFGAEIRAPIPEAERANYKEFAPQG